MTIQNRWKIGIRKRKANEKKARIKSFNLTMVIETFGIEIGAYLFALGM